MGLGWDEERGQPGIWEWLREQWDPWARCINRRREASSEVGGLALHSGAMGSHLETCSAPGPTPGHRNLRNR